MLKITFENAEKLIKSSNGSIFSCEFVKGDGSIRKMTCRLGVKKHLKGGTLSYDPSELNMIPVFDLTKRDYRMIRLDTLRSLTMDGRTFAVV